MSKRFLITGGAGFIGSFLTESLLADGHQVTVADNFSTGCRENLSRVAGNPALKILEMDVTENSARMEELVQEHDVIIHFAAAVGVELVVSEPVRTISTNVKGTENILAPAVKYGKRVILASTSEVYGKSDKDLFSETDDLHLGTPYHSRWSYACSKLLDEFLLMGYVHCNGLRGTVVRFFNTVGPRQTGSYGMVLPRFVGAALRNEPIRIFGTGKQSRCFCHVADVVRALRLLLDDDRSIGNIYNIGSQELVSIAELAQKVILWTGSGSPVEHLSYDQAYGKGFEDMRRRRPDTAAIRNLTGWTPEYSLRQIVESVADYMRTHQNRR